MRKVTFLSLFLAFVGAVSLWMTGTKNRNKKIAVVSECDLYRQKIHSEIDIEKEISRVRGTGLDVDFSSGESSRDGTFLISSSRLDHEQVVCKIEVAAGVISSVQ